MRNDFAAKLAAANASELHDVARSPQRAGSTQWYWSLATLAVFTAALLIWHSFDNRPPAWDESVHLGLAMDYQQWLFHGTPFESRWTAIYPPLYHLSLIPSLMLGDANVSCIVLTHVAYLALLLWGMLNLSRHFTGSTWAGLLATIVFISMPITLHTARQPLIDFALTAWVVAGMEWLRRTQGFSHRRAVIMFGLWSGLGLLMKPFYPMWFIGPVALCAWQGHQATGRWPIKSLCGAALITLLVALPYYGWQGVLFVRNAVQLSGGQGAMEGDPGLGTLSAWWWYAHALVNQVGLVMLVMVLTGCALTIWFNRKHSGVKYLMVWMVSGYLLFTLSHNKDLRYTMPMLPPLAMLALWQVSLWFGKFRLASWLASVAVFAFTATTVDRPQPQEWQHQSLLSVFQKWRDQDGSVLRVALISNHPYLFPRNLEWSARTAGIPLRASVDMDSNANFNEFVVLKSGELYSDRSDRRRRELLANRAFTDYYQKVATLPLPDGSAADVYHRSFGQPFKIDGVTNQVVETKLHAALARDVMGSFDVAVSGDESSLQRGELATLSIKGGPWSVNGVPVSSGEIQLSKARLNLYTLWDDRGLGLLGFDEIKPCLRLSAAEIQQWLRAKQPDSSDVQVQMRNDHVVASAMRSGWRLGLDVHTSLSAEQDAVRVTLDHVMIGSMRVPGWILGRAHQQSVSLQRDDAVPGHIKINSLLAQDGRLSIGCDA